MPVEIDPDYPKGEWLRFQQSEEELERAVEGDEEEPGDEPDR